MKTGPTVAVVIEDDGPGVPVSERVRIFDRFVRLDESRERGTGGAGIGLALVKAIAERHGGTVTVQESNELGGAEFKLSIPSASDS